MSSSDISGGGSGSDISTDSVIFRGDIVDSLTVFYERPISSEYRLKEIYPTFDEFKNAWYSGEEEYKIFVEKTDDVRISDANIPHSLDSLDSPHDHSMFAELVEEYLVYTNGVLNDLGKKVCDWAHIFVYAEDILDYYYEDVSPVVLEAYSFKNGTLKCRFSVQEIDDEKEATFQFFNGAVKEDYDL